MSRSRSIKFDLLDSPAERIALVDDQRRFGRDVGGAADGRQDRAIDDVHRSIEGCADDTLLTPRLAFCEQSVFEQAGKLGARARPAWRTAIRISGAEDEVSAVGVATFRWSEESHLMDRLPGRARDSIANERLTNRPGHLRQPFNSPDSELLGVLGAEEEPIPAPRNVADELSHAVEIDHHVLLVAIAGYVLHGDVSRIVELRGHDADRRLDSMGSGLDVTEV